MTGRSNDKPNNCGENMLKHGSRPIEEPSARIQKRGNENSVASGCVNRKKLVDVGGHKAKDFQGDFGKSRCCNPAPMVPLRG